MNGTVSKRVDGSGRKRGVVEKEPRRRLARLDLPDMPRPISVAFVVTSTGSELHFRPHRSGKVIRLDVGKIWSQHVACGGLDFAIISVKEAADRLANAANLPLFPDLAPSVAPERL